MVVAQWVRRGSSSHRVVHAGGSIPGGDSYQFFSAMIFISVLLGLMSFSGIVILCRRPNSCCQQNLKCFDIPYYPYVCFPGLFS